MERASEPCHRRACQPTVGPTMPAKRTDGCATSLGSTGAGFPRGNPGRRLSESIDGVTGPERMRFGVRELRKVNEGRPRRLFRSSRISHFCRVCTIEVRRARRVHRKRELNTRRACILRDVRAIFEGALLTIKRNLAVLAAGAVVPNVRDVRARDHGLRKVPRGPVSFRARKRTATVFLIGNKDRPRTWPRGETPSWIRDGLPHR